MDACTDAPMWICSLFKWVLLFSGRFVVRGHSWPLADFIRRVCFSAPQIAPLKSLIEAYRGYAYLLHQTSPVLLYELPRSKDAMEMDGQEQRTARQVALGRLTVMPYAVMPTRCECGTHPLNWSFQLRSPRICRACQKAGGTVGPAPKEAQGNSVGTLWSTPF